MTKEEVKLVLMHQLKDIHFPIRFLLKSTGYQHRYLPETIIACSEFSMDIHLRRIDKTDNYDINFVEYDESEYRVKDSCVDLSDDNHLKKEIHYFEKMEFNAIGELHFRLVGFQLENTDYYIRLTETKDNLEYTHKFYEQNSESSASKKLKQFKEKRSNMQTTYHDYVVSDMDKQRFTFDNYPELSKMFLKIIRESEAIKTTFPETWMFDTLIRSLYRTNNPIKG